MARDCDREFEPKVMISIASFPPVLLDVRAKRIEYVLYPFDLYLTRKKNPLFRMYRAPILYFNRDAVTKVDLWAAISNYTRQRMLKVWGKYISKEISVIYPVAIEIDRFQRNIPRERKVCCVGRIHPVKGIDDVIEAFEMAAVPDSKLVIAGGVDDQRISQEYYSGLTKRADAFRNRLEIIPNPSDDAIVETYASSRAFANFNFEEDLGIVPIEAMAAGTPPIVAKGGGQIETVIDRNTGFLVSNVNEMAEKMRSLLTDDTLFQRMSDDAKRHVEMTFSRDMFIQKWREVLERLAY